MFWHKKWDLMYIKIIHQTSENSFLKLVHTEYQVNYKTQPFWVKGVRLKSSRNKKDLNDVTAALFLVSFSQLPAAKKHRKRGSCDVIKVLLIS